MTRHTGTAIALSAAAVALATGGALRNGFVYDDVLAVVHNARVTEPALWHTIVRSPYWIGTLWRPFTVLAFAAQWRLGHGSAALFHAVSLLAYAALGALLMRLLRQTGASMFASVIAALLFLVHPVHVEVVANVVGQSELWTAIALVGMLSLYLHARRAPMAPAVIVALMLLTTVAIASKEAGFTAPLLLIGAEWLLPPRTGGTRRERARLIALVSAVAVILFVYRAGVLQSWAGDQPAMALRGLGTGARTGLMFALVATYARLLVWPWHLQAAYGPPGIPIGVGITPLHIAGVVIVATAMLAFVAMRRRSPAGAFGLWWIAITLLPVSNLIAPTGMVMSERALFLPSVGAAIALSALIDAVRRRAQTHDTGRLDPATAVLATIALAWGLSATWRSAERTTVWRTQAGFFAQLTLDAPTAYRAWKAAGEYWDEVGQHSRGIADLRQSLALWPHDPEAFDRLGQLLRRDGQCNQAIPVFEAGLALQPETSSMRARLIECLIAQRDWIDADRFAAAGIARGQGDFEMERARIARARLNDTVPPRR